MDIYTIIEIVYFIIGLLYIWYDWKHYTHSLYNQYKDNIEESMLYIYWIVVIMFWPFFIMERILKKYF